MNPVQLFTIQISVELDKRYTHAIAEALAPEVYRAPKSSVNVIIGVEDNMVKFLIKGTDSSQIRAVVNSYLRLINVAYNILQITESPAKLKADPTNLFTMTVVKK